MDIAVLAERLERARRAVAEGDADVMNQRKFIGRLKSDGKDTSQAQLVLDALLKRQTERQANLGHAIRQFPPER